MSYAILTRQEKPPDPRLDPQCGEEIGGHPSPGEAHRLANSCHIPTSSKSSSDALKKPRLTANFIDVADEKAAQPGPGARGDIPDPHQAIRLRIRQRRQKEMLH